MLYAYGGELRSSTYTRKRNKSIRVGKRRKTVHKDISSHALWAVQWIFLKIPGKTG